MSGNSVGIRELQQNASKVVSRAAAGEIVTITDRGRPVALLTPLGGSRLEAMVRAGFAQPARIHPRDLPPPLPAIPGRPTLGELLEEARREERY